MRAVRARAGGRGGSPQPRAEPPSLRSHSFEQHVEQEQRALQQQRRRLYGEVAEEKERLGQQAARCPWEGVPPAPRVAPRPAPPPARAELSPAHRQRAELEELRQQLEESSAAEGRALRAEFEKGREEQECRHQVRRERPLWGCRVGGCEGRWAKPGLVRRAPQPARPGTCPGGSGPALTVTPAPQMEMKTLKDQLEAERQMWEASCTKKEVGAGSSLLPGTPGVRTATCGFPFRGLPVGTVLAAQGLVVVLLCARYASGLLQPFSGGVPGETGGPGQIPLMAKAAFLTLPSPRWLRSSSSGAFCRKHQPALPGTPGMRPWWTGAQGRTRPCPLAW